MNTRTVKVRSVRAGGYSLATAGTSTGPDTMVYGIQEVPASISDQQVLAKMHDITFSHSLDDPGAWKVRWSDIKDRPRHTIINRHGRSGESSYHSPDNG